MIILSILILLCAIGFCITNFLYNTKRVKTIKESFASAFSIFSVFFSLYYIIAYFFNLEF